MKNTLLLTIALCSLFAACKKGDEKIESNEKNPTRMQGHLNDPSSLTVSTISKNSQTGQKDGPLSTALFQHPDRMVIDSAGKMFVQDHVGNNLSKLRIISPEGIVTTFPVASDQYIDGGNITLSKDGTLYGIAGIERRIYKFKNGVIEYLSICEHIATGERVKAKIYPHSLAVANDGTIYITEPYYDRLLNKNTNRIRKITKEGIVSPFSSDEPGYKNGDIKDARFNGASLIQISNDGTIYVVDNGNRVIRKISTTGQVSTVPGSEQLADNTTIWKISGLTLDDDGSIYLLNKGKLIRISTTGDYSIIAGSVEGYKDGPALQALFYGDYGNSNIALYDGKLFIADRDFIRKVE